MLLKLTQIPSTKTTHQGFPAPTGPPNRSGRSVAAEASELDDHAMVFSRKPKVTRRPVRFEGLDIEIPKKQTKQTFVKITQQNNPMFLTNTASRDDINSLRSTTPTVSARLPPYWDPWQQISLRVAPLANSSAYLEAPRGLSWSLLWLGGFLHVVFSWFFWVLSQKC